MQVEALSSGLAPCSGDKPRLVRTISVVGPATPDGGAAAAPPPHQAREAGAAAAPHGASEEAADAGAALVSDDELLVEEPRDPRAMSLPRHMAALQLMKERLHREAAAMWDQIIRDDPDKAEWYHNRGVARMQLGREQEAVHDLTLCLELPDCQPFHRFQCLLFRGQIKQHIGDLGGADEDYKAAQDAATDEARRQLVKESRMLLLKERVSRRQQKEATKKARRPPVVHRYGTAVIEELDPEEGSEEHGESVAHERAAAWQEAALKLAAEARGRAGRIAREFETEQQRVREENQARQDRNAVRQARRRRAAEVAAQRRRRQEEEQAAPAAAAATQGLANGQVQGAVLLERTRIPIEVVEGGASGASDDTSSISSSGSSRSTTSRQAGYCGEVESGAGEEEQEEEEEEHGGSVAADGATGAIATPAPVEAGAGAAEDEAPPAAAEVSAAVEAAEAAAQEEAEEAAEEPVPPPAAAPADREVGAAAVAPAPAPAAAAAPASSMPPPLLSESELDGVKEEADRLQREGDVEGAEKLYARYLSQRPADLRAWSNWAENCCKAQRWQAALECCSQGLAVSTPSHAVPRHKLLYRRGVAYRGMGRLQEALRSLEEADAAAEAEGEHKAKRLLAKHIMQVLEAMAAQGTQPAPRDPAALGMPGAALPAMPVVPPRPPHVVPEEAELEVPPAAAAPAGEPACHTAAPAPAEAAAAGPAEAAAQAAAAEREQGNACFKRRQWELALRHYERASQLHPGCKLALANQAAALLKLRRWREAEHAASQALALDSSFTKARYRRAHAYAGDNNLQFALLDMQIVAEADPGDAAVQRELAAMRTALREEGQSSFVGADVVTSNPLFSPTSRAGK